MVLHAVGGLQRSSSFIQSLRDLVALASNISSSSIVFFHYVSRNHVNAMLSTVDILLELPAFLLVIQGFKP